MEELKERRVSVSLTEPLYRELKKLSFSSKLSGRPYNITDLLDRAVMDFLKLKQNKE